MRAFLGTAPHFCSAVVSARNDAGVTQADTHTMTETSKTENRRFVTRYTDANSALARDVQQECMTSGKKFLPETRWRHI
jgi:hypothetical protein